MLNNIPVSNKSIFIGVGNLLKQDDGFGPAVIREIAGKITAACIDAGVALENFSGKIRNLHPDCIIIFDAVDFNGNPGETRLFKADDLMNETFSTHGVSIKTFIDFIKADVPAQVFIIGAQPRKTGFGQAMSEPVEKAVMNAAQEVIKKCTNLE